MGTGPKCHRKIIGGHPEAHTFGTLFVCDWWDNAIGGKYIPGDKNLHEHDLKSRREIFCSDLAGDKVDSTLQVCRQNTYMTQNPMYSIQTH